MMASSAVPFLDVRGLTVEFATRRGTLRAVHDVSFTIGRGESVAIIGESGSGKTTTGLAILRLVRPPGCIAAGSVSLNGTDLLDLKDEELRKLRGNRIS